MSEDPKGFDAGDYNLFRYCHNDPLDRVDPMGLGDEQVNAQMVKVGYATLAMHAQTVLPIGSNIPVLAVRLANAQWVDYRAAGGLSLAQSFQAMRQGLHMGQMTVQNRMENRSAVRTISRNGYLRIDTDGTGSDHGDPTHGRNNETAYQPNGRSLNADTDPYVAIPTALLRRGVRLGDRAVLSVNGRSAPGVVGDTGADPRFVEASLRLVHDVGVRTRDVPRTGPVPDTPGGREVWATMTLYPSGP
jgi:hypothetical protein